MHGRSPVAVAVLVLAGSAALAQTAGAQTLMSSVDQAAASVDFGLFVPGRTFGTSVHEVRMTDVPPFQGCPAGEKSVVVSYTRRHSRRSISLVQTGRPCSPARPDGAKIRRVKILGRRVTIHRFCAGTRYSCSHERRGDTVLNAKLWLRSPSGRTEIQVTTYRLSVRQTVRALRSLRLVDLSRPVVALSRFRSPDGAIMCWLYDDREDGRFALCGTDEPARSAWLSADGEVSLCDQDPFGCMQSWDFAAPLLAAGQSSRFGQFTCTEAALAITCTVAGGEHAGKGFRIDAAGVAAVAPAPPG